MAKKITPLPTAEGIWPNGRLKNVHTIEIDIKTKCQEIAADGFCIFRDLLPKEVIYACNHAFAPVLQEHITAAGDQPNRGSARHFVPLPFAPPFNNPILYENDVLLTTVAHLLGNDMAIGTYATDTPLQGSVYQDVHSDISPLFPGEDLIPPPYVIAINFPFVDVTPENGPFEIARGTHLIAKEEALRQVKSGEIELEPLFLNVGDVLVRDPRCLHRGTPNRTSTPRPVAVISIVRSWYRFVYIPFIPQKEHDKFSDRAKDLFRFIPVQ